MGRIIASVWSSNAWNTFVVDSDAIDISQLKTPEDNLGR